MKSTVITIAFVFAFLCGVVGFGLTRNNHPKKLGALAASSETSDSPSQLSSNNQSTGEALGATTDDSNSSISLQSNSGQASSSAEIPGPETFGQYDKYVNDEHALFIDLQKGDGAEAETNKNIAVVYKGWLTNGKLFDQSQIDKVSGKIQAFQFVLGGGSVIQGWDEGLVGMKVGGTRRLVVPPKVGYGSQGHDPIPPNSVMVFDVQLIQVQ